MMTQESTIALPTQEEVIQDSLASPITPLPVDVAQEMEERRKVWLKHYKTHLDLNDVLEIRNPQSVIEFVPEIIMNMQAEEERHMYPKDFLESDF